MSQPRHAPAADNGGAHTTVRHVEVAPTEGGNRFYPGNRPPLQSSPLIKLPAGSVTPRGWLCKQLALMADGMMGHMSELSPRVRPGSGWLEPEGFGDEWVPYWLKGYVSLGHALGDQPFTAEGTPIELAATGRRIPNWTMVNNCPGKLQPSPIRSDEPTDQIALIPMGAARLRISAFPVIGGGPDARDWIWSGTRHSASHCYGADTVEAMSDGELPTDSGGRSIPHFSWWPHRGTSEWVTTSFEQPREVSGVELYWYDDRRHGGHCRVPQSWQIEWLDSGRWRLVEAAGTCGVERDTFNRVGFGPVTTDSIRLLVQLQPDWSGGILEWRVR